MQTSEILKSIERLSVQGKAEIFIGMSRMLLPDVGKIAAEISEIEMNENCDAVHDFASEFQYNYCFVSGEVCDHIVDYGDIRIGYNDEGDAIRAFYITHEVPRKLVTKAFVETDRREGRRVAA